MAEQTDAHPQFPVVETCDYSLIGDVQVRPLNKFRRVIARRMRASWAYVPMVVQFDDADITEALRADLNQRRKRPQSDSLCWHLL